MRSSIVGHLQALCLRGTRMRQLSAIYPHVCSLPANFGFDPLNLGTNPEALKWWVRSGCKLNDPTAMMPQHALTCLPGRYILANCCDFIALQVPAGRADQRPHSHDGGRGHPDPRGATLALSHNHRRTCLPLLQ